jgi:transcriptional regulator with XRE-family HTH domain
MSPETVEGLTDLGRAIRDARLARRLRHQDLASRAGISVATLKRLERGDPTLAIGRVLEVLTALSPTLLADLVETVRADPAGDALRRKAMGERSKRDDF